MANTTDSDRPRKVQIAFLAALVYNPMVLILWLLYSYPLSTQCFAGPFCTFDQFPGFLQLLFVVLGMILTWSLVWAVIRIGTSRGLGNDFGSSIRFLTTFGELRSVFTAYGVVLLTLLIVAIGAGRGTAPMIAFALLTGILLVSLVLSDTPKAAPTLSAAKGYVPPKASGKPVTPPPSPNLADLGTADANSPPPDF